MMNNSLKNSLLVSFSEEVRYEFYQQKNQLCKNIDLIAIGIMQIVFDRKGKTEISQEWLAKLLITSRKVIRSRLIMLAKFGFIRVEWKYCDNNFKTCSVIELNPIMYAFIEKKVKLSQIKSYIRHAVSMYIRRLYDYDEDMQGFHVDCKFGNKEPNAIEAKPEKALIDFIEKEDNKKASQLRERLLWKERSDIVVAGAASLWIWAQEQLGMGSASPNWLGDINTMGLSAKAQRNEIVKTFLHYGGRVTSLAWYVFVGGIPELDEKTGLPIFTLAEPHRQYVTIDRKPSQFAKHFNAILKDHVFIKLATEGWAVFYPKLKDHFKGTIDVGPKSGDSDELLAGITFGPLNSND